MTAEIPEIPAKKRPRAPTGLGPEGRKLWRETVRFYVLRPDEQTILAQACRTADLVERLRADVAAAPSTVPGSRGQEVANPLLVEIRLQRGELNRLLRSLELPDLDSADTKRSRDRSGRFSADSGRKAALARWSRPSG